MITRWIEVKPPHERIRKRKEAASNSCGISCSSTRQEEEEEQK